MNPKSQKQYIVKGFSPECPSAYQRKFMAMGFIPGSIFTFIRAAPLGDPWQVEIKGVMLSLRKGEFHWLHCEECHG